MPLTSDEDLSALLSSSRTIAVIGASDNPGRPSYGVSGWLSDHGWRVIPVNPRITGEHVHNEYVWHDLSQVGVPIDIVDVFRRPEDALDAVEQAIAAKAKAVWFQLGVVNEAAIARAEEAGLKTVVDRCIKIDAARLRVSPPPPSSPE
ncbi:MULTISPECIES: CoA-binding protein [Sphingomonas]|uniref:CoA-binding protein n=1 Tax=Sphingomonas TaxID=13687 RepID=UPI000DEF74A9|nr:MULTISPECIES: CoA-binding protein [Sphingomonas]